MTQPNQAHTQSAQKTRDQERAADAWAAVRRHANLGHAKEFKALVRGFPALILTNGLGHALTFLRAKNKPHHKALYDALNLWIGDHMGAQRTDLLEWLMEHSSDHYRRATTEALAYLVWLKRFAEAEIQGEGEA